LTSRPASVILAGVLRIIIDVAAGIGFYGLVVAALLGRLG
jgi:hypothetical protein